MDSIIYTDGHGTRVTTHEFVAGDSKYLIQGIVDARMNRVYSSVMPAIVCLLFGVIFAALGYFRMLDNQELNLTIGSIYMTASRIAGILGFILIFIGVLGLLWRHKKYSVHITTAEGERDPIVSNKKDYVRQIVSALNNAKRHLRR